MTAADGPSPHVDRPARQAVVLRAQRADDLTLLVGGDTPFDSFGPPSQRAAPAGHDLEADGALTVTADDEVVVGEVSWHWQRYRYGPNAASSCVMIGISLRPEHRGRDLGSAAQP